MARRSRILPIVFRLVVGRKLDMSDVETPGFFSNGLIWPDLNMSGKHPMEKARFANLVINGANASTQPLRASTDC